MRSPKRDPSREGDVGAGALIGTILGALLSPAYTTAQLAFAEARVLALTCALLALGLGVILWFEPARWNWDFGARSVVSCVIVVFAACACGFGLKLLNDNGSSGGLRLEQGVAIPGSPPLRVAFGRDGVGWVGSQNGMAISFDPATRQPIGRPVRIGRSIQDMTIFRGFLFATVNHGELLREDTSPVRTRRRRAKYGKSGGEISVGDGSIWVNDAASSRVFRYSLNLKRIAVIRLSRRRGSRASALAFAPSGLLWVADRGINALYGVDPLTNRVAVWKSVPRDPHVLTVAGNVLYVAHPAIRIVERRDASTGEQIGEPIGIEGGSVTLEVALGRLFVCSTQGDRLLQFSAQTGQPIGPRLRIGHSPTDLAFIPGRNELWITNRADESVTPVVIERGK